jgi:hypothetical protein
MRIKYNFGKLSSAKAREKNGNCQRNLYSFIYIYMFIYLDILRGYERTKTVHAQCNLTHE